MSVWERARPNARDLEKANDEVKGRENVTDEERATLKDSEPVSAKAKVWARQNVRE